MPVLPCLIRLRPVLPGVWLLPAEVPALYLTNLVSPIAEVLRGRIRLSLLSSRLWVCRTGDKHLKVRDADEVDQSLWVGVSGVSGYLVVGSEALYLVSPGSISQNTEYVT